MKQKVLSILLALLMIFNMLPVTALSSSQGYDFMDMPNNWSTEALTKAVEDGLLSGYNGKLNPQNNLTRVEMAAVINRAFGAKGSADISSYTDVKPTDWFYGEMSKAVGMGTFQGYANQLRPNDPITREEVFSVLSNALKLRAEKANKMFMDSNEVSEWAQESLNGMINGGYVGGSNGKLNPKANITRAEFAQVMHNIIKDYVNTATVYEEVNAGNVIVNTPNATLKNVTVKGDLIIADGVGEGEVTLDNVKVEGRMLVRAGGENSIIIKGDSEIDTIIIVKQGNKVRIFNETGKEIAVATVEGTADVILEGKFKNVVIQSPNITVYAQNTEIENVEINGTRSKVIVDEDSEIEKIEVIAANVVIEGKGTVEEVEVKAGGNGTEITTPDTQINVDRGANDVVGTGGVEIKPNETYVNGKTDKEDAKPLEQTTSTGGSGGGTVTTYTVNYSVVGSNGTLTGTVVSGNSVNSGTSVIFTATPSIGYEIKEWKVNGAVVTSGNTITRTVSTNTTVTVEFKAIVAEPTMYTVAYSVIGSGGTLTASVPNGGTALAGSSVDFTATPNDGYKLKGWTVNGEFIDWLTGLQISHDISKSVDVKVEFELIEVPPTMYTVNFSRVGTMGELYATVEGVGNIYDGNQVEEGTDVTFTAIIPSGYEIKEWRYNDYPVEAEGNTLTISNIGMDIAVTVEFAVIPIYEAIVQIENVESATVTVKDSENNNRLVTEIIFGKIHVYNLEAGDYTVIVEKEGYYTVERTLTIPSTNYVSVTMEEVLPGIVTINNPPIIELNVGHDLPTLPATVDVVLDTEEVVTLDVIWNTDGFDKNSPESYVLGGTLVLIDGIENPLRLVALQLVDVFAAPKVTLDITNTSILRFNFDVPAAWVGETSIADIGTPEYPILTFLQDLFGDTTLDATVLNEDRINVYVEPFALEIQLLDDAINRDLFFALDHPDGYYHGNGDGVYRKDVTVDLSIFNNHLGLTSTSTAEPFKLKFTANYEYGLPDYQGVISGVWQTAEQREADIDPIMDTTPPIFASITTSPDTLGFTSIEEPGEYDIWVNEGEIVVIEVTANEDNLYRFSPFSDIWYYALPDVYNGDEATRANDLDAGVTVTYANGIWTVDLGEDVSSKSNIIRFLEMDFEDYAGNRWSDIETNPTNRTFLINLLRFDKEELNAQKGYVETLNSEDYTQDSWETLMNVLTMPETTQEEIDNKTMALGIAIMDLVPYIKVTSVKIDDKYSNIVVGQKYNLETIITPSDSTNPNVIWSIVSGPGQIDHTGELIANGEGVIVVRATSEDNSEVYSELAFTGILTPPNTAPVPYNYTESIDNSMTKLIDVLSLSTDIDEDELSITEWTQGTYGVVTLEYGELRYLPNEGFVGIDEFTYTITDGTNTAIGTVEIEVSPSGILVGAGNYERDEIQFYRKSSGELKAVLTDQISTQEIEIDSTYTSILGVETLNSKLRLIYTNGNIINIVDMIVFENTIEIVGNDEITSNGGGTLSSIQYVKDSSNVLHFVYMDSMGQSSQYEMPDLMYYNTVDKDKKVLHFGFRENYGGADYYNSYVHELEPLLTIDNYDNVVVMYVYRNWESWMGGQNHNYFLQLRNITGGPSISLEAYGATRASMRFSNLKLTGGNDITVEYTYDSTPYVRVFAGGTLTEK